MMVPYQALAPLYRGWMDRASSDCWLLYEIIGSRGCACAIQTPIPATNLGSNREREIEEREGGHRRCDLQSCSPWTSEYTPLFGSVANMIVLLRGGEAGIAGDGRSDTLSLLANGESRVTFGPMLSQKRDMSSTDCTRMTHEKAGRPQSMPLSIRLPSAIGEFNWHFGLLICVSR